MGYLTYIGPGEVGNYPFFASENTLYSIAVDAAGNAYLAGTTSDPNFPATPGSYQTLPPSPIVTTGFLAKLNTTGSAMVWATISFHRVLPSQSPPMPPETFGLPARPRLACSPTRTVGRGALNFSPG